MASEWSMKLQLCIWSCYLRRALAEHTYSPRVTRPTFEVSLIAQGTALMFFVWCVSTGRDLTWRERDRQRERGRLGYLQVGKHTDKRKHACSVILCCIQFWATEIGVCCENERHGLNKSHTEIQQRSMSRQTEEEIHVFSGENHVILPQRRASMPSQLFYI